MKKCPSCGYDNPNNDIRCPECGSFYSKIIEAIEEIVSDEEKHSLRGRYQRIINADNKKAAFNKEWQSVKAGIDKQGWLVIFVIFVFVFWLIAIVL